MTAVQDESGSEDLRERVARAIAAVEFERRVSDIDWSLLSEKARESYRMFGEAAVAEMRDQVTPFEPRERGWHDVLSAHDEAKVQGWCCCSACLLESVQRGAKEDDA